jgi:3-oxoadipate enol-lactonase
MTPIGKPAALAWTSKGAGPIIIFLHPIGLSGGFWDDVSDLLAGDLRCVAVDLRGHGRSGWDGREFRLDDLARDVIRCITECELSPTLLVGCSLGGMVAQGVALQWPHLSSGLVLSNSAAFVPEPARPSLAVRAALARSDPAGAAEECINRWFPPGFREDHPGKVDYIRAALRAADRDVVAQAWSAIAGLDYLRRLGSLSSPVTLVTGELDPSSPPASSVEHAQAFHRARTFVVAGSGHLTPYEKPREFAAIVRNAALGI